MVVRPNEKGRHIAALIANIALVVMEIPGMIGSIESHGASMFRFYTQDSNLFALVACAIFVYFAVRNLRRGVYAVPMWVKTVKYMVTCCLMVTFLVVVCVLAPMYGPGSLEVMLFSDHSLYVHFLCPLVALISFVFFEGGAPLEKKHVLYALIPTLVYGVVMLALNILRVVHGPYPFLYVYEQPVYMTALWYVAIFLGAYLIAWLIRFANAKLSGMQKNRNSILR